MKGTTPIVDRSLGGLRQTAKRIYWRTYGLFLSHPPVPPSPESFLFVCKGNICRSPFAEALARRRIPDGKKIVCRSAGIAVADPEGCPRETLDAAGRFGIDLAGHRSRRIDQGLVEGADMIFAMEAWQLARLRKVFPRNERKLFLLPLFDRNPPPRSDRYNQLNIRDPYGRSIGDFIECFERIDACLEGIFSLIRERGFQTADDEVGSTDRASKRR